MNPWRELHGPRLDVIELGVADDGAITASEWGCLVRTVVKVAGSDTASVALAWLPRVSFKQLEADTRDGGT